MIAKYFKDNSLKLKLKLTYYEKWTPNEISANEINKEN